MNDDELTAVLEDAGLSPYQSEAYVTLLGLGTASATDVAEACDVPDPRIYDVLRDLEEKGYVETFQQDSLTARAHDPREVRGDLESRSAQFLEAADAIEERWSQPAVSDHELTVVKRFGTVVERAQELIRAAETQVTVAVPAADVDVIADDLAAAHERGVLVRITVSAEHPEDDPPDPTIFDGICTEARYRLTPAPFLVIVDRTWTAFMPAQGTATQYGLLVNDSAHTSMFQWVFSTVLWGSCDVIYRDPDTERPRAYVDIRRCLADLEDPLADGATVDVEVVGNLIETGERVELAGTVERLNLGTPDESDVDPMTRPAGPLSLTLRTESGDTYDVGGWGACIEDVEATRITVTDVSSD